MPIDFSVLARKKASEWALALARVIVMGSYEGQTRNVEKIFIGSTAEKVVRTGGRPSTVCSVAGPSDHATNTGRLAAEGGTMSHRSSWRRWNTRLALAGCLTAGVLAQAGAQIEQRVEVTIKDFTFITKQVPLMPNVPSVMTIRNDDEVRHDFGSTVFQNTLTHVESDGVISYGQGIGGLFLDPSREALVRFVIERPGRYELRCSIHPKMRGELLLLNIGAV